MAEPVRVTVPAEIAAVLSDERFTVVPPVPDETGGMAWVRRRVSRFAEGEAHRRRRALSEAELAAVSPHRLSVLARDEAAAVYAADPAGTARPDGPGCGYAKAVALSRVEHRLVFDVPTRALGRALGAGDPARLVPAVAAAAPAYLARAEPSETLDRAVSTLVELLGPGEDETVAARIALLLQAHAPTSTLVLAVLKRDPFTVLSRESAGTASAADLVAEALGRGSPVPVMRRVAAEEVVVNGTALPAGTPVVLDVAAASGEHGHDPDLAFGTGRRPCPGRAHALAVATGIIEEVLAR